MRFSKLMYYIGLAACVVLIIACFMPWTYYPVVNETFTGFYVKKFPTGTYYGRAGVLITLFAVVILIFMLLPRVWAKRTNLLLSALLIAYAFRTYHIFTSSLVEGDVIAKPGIYLVLICPFVILLACLFPDIKIVEQKKD